MNTILKTIVIGLSLVISIQANAQSEKFKIQNPYYSRTATNLLNVSNTEWKKILNTELYKVAREGATETAFTGKYYEFDEKGTYYCAVCGNPLFLSTSKFATTCGWPSFYQPIHKNNVKYRKDTSYNMVRTEVLCGRCGSHLGHIFDDGPEPTGKRFCMNSVCLDFTPIKK
ncbi:peptide-methionine (R)-S-oxide reductase MsrB [Elizabethkingia miricola]|uniref:peptide-methionine (R)-S-oxide reductase MsrB n=1 Tax=Elizabethkingia miricola TaxID=172045 RepID=UPI000B34DC8C|nr:peptide-methionine (R)-S-oxide reductase MsrB [Elizabethkingia miricola]NHQ68021.1 peptide-methionine (R)-S-oxide reductase MsrB [Elizabethkingia miricola]NHQ72181.1 peptide-methionine (R)-S-oxide reductase MsrB [Elizabethkingia miricola]NHQ79197.1 peptide-methionine (R)-S-oxide reductase MsrB [Elizabethkingia miricola]PSL87023.1 peptide-methionine (R)-S-oxide reductase [Elizabethkingia miricola]QHQ85907.1 peptide-methionine (R)-S-oxide reductase MsrB [Elizabethkingia miricola]